MAAKRSAALLAALLPLLWGCQWLAPPPQPAPQVQPQPQPVAPPLQHRSLAELIAYFLLVDSLPAVALERETTAMENQLRSEASPDTRLCLAYLLGRAAHKPGYRRRAERLFTEIEQALYTPAEYKDLARFLANDLRRRAAQRDSLRAERQQRRQLQQQLDALKDIERKISERKTMPIDGVEGPKP